MAWLVGGCSSGTQSITVELTVGQEMSALDRTPPVTRLDVTATNGAGVVVSASAAPGGTFDLGEYTTGDIISIQASGLDASAETVVRGRSLSGIALGGVASDVLPVFVQRTHEWARPAGGLDHTHVGGVAGSIGERYLLLTGGTAAAGTSGSVGSPSVAAFDLFGLQGATMTAFPRAARSLVALASTALVVDDAGATWIDFSSGASSDVVSPTGLASFAEVAGGATLADTEGSCFVVGATRVGPPTRAVLRVAADGATSALSLGAARAGAAAAWIADVGLVVSGGSATGAGVEILSIGATAFASTTFPPDATVGAAVAPASKGAFAVVGGSLDGKPAATRTFALDCGASCDGVPFEAASLPMATRRTTAFSLGGLRMLVVADDAATASTTRTFVVDLGARTQKEIALREPRAGATPVPAPNGTLALLGGAHPDGTPALSVEIFFPE